MTVQAKASLSHCAGSFSDFSADFKRLKKKWSQHRNLPVSGDCPKGSGDLHAGTSGEGKHGKRRASPEFYPQ